MTASMRTTIIIAVAARITCRISSSPESAPKLHFIFRPKFFGKLDPCCRFFSSRAASRMDNESLPRMKSRRIDQSSELRVGANRCRLLRFRSRKSTTGKCRLEKCKRAVIRRLASITLTFVGICASTCQTFASAKRKDPTSQMR